MKRNFTILFFLFVISLVMKGQVNGSGPMSTEPALTFTPRPRVFITVLDYDPSGPVLHPIGFTGVVEIDPQTVFTSVKVFNPDGIRICCPRQSIFRLDFSGQPKGTYTVQIENGKERSTRKIVIE
jgi:hypothetical protein